MNQARNVAGIFLSKLLGVLIFLVILGLLNFLIPYVDEFVFREIVGFLNANLLLILLFTLFFCVAEMFFALVFPINLPAPLFSSFGSVFLVSFIFNVLGFIDSNFKMGLNGLLNEVYFFIVVIVFLIVFISGYIIVFSRGMRRRVRRVRIVRRRRMVGGRRISRDGKLRYVNKNGWDRDNEKKVEEEDLDGEGLNEEDLEEENKDNIKERKDEEETEEEVEEFLGDEDEEDEVVEEDVVKRGEKKKFKKIPSKKTSLKEVRREVRRKK